MPKIFFSLKKALVLGCASGFTLGYYNYHLQNKSLLPQRITQNFSSSEVSPSSFSNVRLIDSLIVKAKSLDSGPFSIPLSRTVQWNTDGTSKTHNNDQNFPCITLFQYETCPFCCKVKAYLNFRGIDYNVVEVNSIFQSQIKWSKGKYSKVPIVVIGNKNSKNSTEPEFVQLNDSSVIISALESYYEQQQLQKQSTSGFKLLSKSGLTSTSAPETFKIEDEGHFFQTMSKMVEYYPSYEVSDEYRKGRTKIEFPNCYFLMREKELDKEQYQMDERLRKWRKWVDKVFVHTIAPNIYRTPTEALEAFHYVDEVGEWNKHFSVWERYLVIYLGAVVMYFIGKRLITRYELDPVDVRSSLYGVVNDWMKEVKKAGGKFHGGLNNPNLADLAVFGTLSSVEGCQAFRDVMVKYPDFKVWYYNVKARTTHTSQLNVKNGSQSVVQQV